MAEEKKLPRITVCLDRDAWREDLFFVGLKPDGDMTSGIRSNADPQELAFVVRVLYQVTSQWLEDEEGPRDGDAIN